MSIFSNPSKVIHNVLDELTAFVKGPLYSFIQPTLQAAKSYGEQILISAAMGAVAAGEAAGGSGVDKMKIALEFFKKSIENNGRDFIESEARAFIELAYQKFKSTTSDAPIVTGGNPVSAFQSFGQ